MYLNFNDVDLPVFSISSFSKSAIGRSPGSMTHSLFVFVLVFGFSAFSAQSFYSQADPACTAFSFEGPTYADVAGVQSALEVVDINHDGIPDVVTVIPDFDQVSVLLGRDDGTLQSPAVFSVGDFPQGLAVADFDRDGELDIAVTVVMSDSVTILKGNGLGAFTFVGSFTVTGDPDKIASADMNNDSWPDLIVNTDQALQIYLGSYTGFTRSAYLESSLPDFTSIATADINEDGNMDIALSFAGSTTDGGVAIFMGNGTGGAPFTSAFFSTTRMRGLLVKDFTGDGNLDIVAAGYAPASGGGSGKLMVLTGQGNGGFIAPPQVEGYVNNGEMASGDFNHDGDLDFATSNAGIYLGDGNGSFTLSDGAYPIIGPLDVAAADFDGDGHLDVIQANDWRSRLYTTRGDGTGKLLTPSYSTVLQRPDSIAADFNGDGKMDVATLHANGTVYVALQNAEGEFQIINDSWVYISGTSTTTSSNTIEAADFNGDGRADLAFTEAVFNRLVILLNNGNNTFTTVSVGFVSTLQRPDVVRVADLNNDGKQDVAVLSATTSMFAIVQGNGDGTFIIRPERPVTDSANFLHSMAITDIDNDGNKDLLIGRGFSRYQVFSGNGDGTFDPAQNVPTSRAVYQIKTADINDDGLSDVLLTYGNLNTSYLTTRVQAAGNTSITTEYLSVPAGESITPIVADFDLDGIKDVIVGGGGFPFSEAGLFRGSGNGQLTFAGGFPNLGGEAFSSADFNNDGKPDYASVGAVYLNTAIVGPCLSISNSSVAEANAAGTSNMTFTVSLSAPSTQAVTVKYKLVGRNAVVGSDLPPATGTVTFLPGSVSETVSIPVSGDNLDELDETLNVVLFDAQNASIKDGFGIGTILDNDDPPVISIGDVSMLEGSGGYPRFDFPLSLSAPSGRLTKVLISTTNGTATSPTDFAATSHVFGVAPGVVNSSFSVTVVPDTLVEADESFSVNLSSPEAVVVGDGNAVGTILNDDIGGNVQFGFSTKNAKEHSTVTVDITRLNGNASNIVVGYSTSNGTAIAGQDYTATTGQVIFGANETSKSFTVPILIDQLDEDDETIQLSITGVSGGASLGTPTSATVVIVDDDPLPVVSASAIALSEGNGGMGIANLVVNLSSPSGREVRVNYASRNGTAISPDDYIGVSGTLIFQPGETSRNIEVAIVGDRISEINETFEIAFDSPFNASLGVGVAVITILNDDRYANFDYDGDGKSDLSVRRPSDNIWYILRGTAGYFNIEFGVAGDLIAPADFDGDGKTDIAVFRPSNGTWYTFNSGSQSFTTTGWGADGDLPVPADHDGDGRADLVVFRPSTNTWYTRFANGTFSTTAFGVAGDKPVVGDFDGDGKADIGLYRPSDNNWYILKTGFGFFVQTWGVAGDIPVPADYDGDGKTDVSVFRQSTGQWFRIRSTAGFDTVNWGANGDQPIPADYDGDGKSDVAVFRPSNATWYIVGSTSGQLIQNYGVAGDLPTQGAFLY